MATYNALTLGQLNYRGAYATAESATPLTATGPNVIVPFGIGVVRGASDNLIAIPSATGQYFMGIALATDTIEKRAGYSIDSDGIMGWPARSVLSYLRRGIVAVPVTTDCVQGGAVYCIHTGGAGQPVGHFRKDANTDKADLVPNAVFWKTLTAAGLGLIRINLP